MTQANNSSNVIIKDVALFWAKLDKPVSPFGVDQYELQIQGDKKREKEFSQFGKVKPVEGGKISVNLKKKAFKKDGTEAAKVRVVDAGKKELDPKLIGNGSIGNVMVYCSPYEIKLPNGKISKSGTSTMLVAVQVTDLIRYERKSDNFVDFDVEGASVDTDASEEAMF
jgi:hypothetical protein